MPGRWMDGWVDGWIKGCTGGYTCLLVCGCVDVWLYECMGIRIGVMNDAALMLYYITLYYTILYYTVQ